jgi:hypothetical protein
VSTPLSACRAALAAAALALLLSAAPAPAADLTATFNPSLASPMGSDPPPTGGPFWDYAPSVVEDGNTRYVFTCSNPSGSVLHDDVRLSVGTRVSSTAPWTYGPLSSSFGPSAAVPYYNAHTCDPEVVRGAFTLDGHTYPWAILFTAAQNRASGAAMNMVGVALSDSLTAGPSGWHVLPAPLITSATDGTSCSPTSQEWCVGQPSATSIDGQGNFMLFYTNDGLQLQRRVINLSNANAPVIGARASVPTAGLPSVDGAGVYLHNASLAYDGTRDRFWMSYDAGSNDVGGVHNQYVQSSVVVATIEGGAIWGASGTWKVSKIINSCQTGLPFNHNSGIVRSQYGTIADAQRPEIDFAISHGGGAEPFDYRLYAISGPTAFVSADPPALVANQDGRLELLGRDEDRCGSYAWNDPEATASGAYDHWSKLGASPSGRPVPILAGDNRVWLFARASDGTIWMNVQSSAGSRAYSGWSHIEVGGSPVAFTGRPVPFRDANGRIGVVARRGDSHDLVIRQTAPGTWPSAWTDLGAAPDADPVAGVNADGRVQLFARATPGNGGLLWTNPQGAANGAFTGWSAIGGHAFDGITPAVARQPDGRLVVFGRNDGAQVWAATQATAGGAFGAWTSLGASPAGDPAAATDSGGRIVLAARAADGTLWWNRQKAVSGGGSFGGWGTAGGSLSDQVPALAREADGRLQLAARWTDGTIRVLKESAPNAGFGTTWATAG